MLGAVLGGIAGLLTGGTAMAAAVGAGLGRLASGGDLEDALKDGALAFGIGSIPELTPPANLLLDTVGAIARK